MIFLRLWLLYGFSPERAVMVLHTARSGGRADPGSIGAASWLCPSLGLDGCLTWLLGNAGVP